MNDAAFVYHRYNLDPVQRKVWLDPVAPVIAAIATLRAVNPTVKVYVLDTEPFLEDWGDFPRLLDFHVVQQPCQIPIPYNGGCPFQSRMVSRIWDVWAFARLIPERIIVYSDADVFWSRDPLPLDNDPVTRFYGDDRGDGFFYFDKHSLETEVFVNAWRGLTLAGILSDEVRTMMRISGYHTPMFLAEMPYCYLVRNGMRQGWGLVGRLEHYFPDSLGEPIEPGAKCLHAHSGLFGRDRLAVVRRVVEFAASIRGVLPAPYANLLLGDVVADTPFQRVAELGNLPCEKSSSSPPAGSPA